MRAGYKPVERLKDSIIIGLQKSYTLKILKNLGYTGISSITGLQQTLQWDIKYTNTLDKYKIMKQERQPPYSLQIILILQPILSKIDNYHGSIVALTSFTNGVQMGVSETGKITAG